MRRKHLVGAYLLSLACCLALTPSAHAQDTYKLADKSAVGDVAQTEQELSMDVTMKSAAAGTSAAFHYSMQETEKYLQSLLSKDSKGKMDGLRRTYTVYREVKKDGNGQKVSTSPLQGKTVVIQRKGNAVVVTSPNGTLSKGDRIAMQDVLGGGFDFVPDHAVAIGDEWEVDPKKIAHTASFKDIQNASIQVKLLDIGSFDGHRCARLHINMHVELPVEKDVAMQLDFGGDGHLALDIERMLDMDLRGPVVFAGSGIGQGSAIESGEGTAHLKVALHWQKIAGKPLAASKP